MESRKWNMENHHLFEMLLLLIVAYGTLPSMAFASSQRPNIIVIFADDLGYNDISFHGSNQIPTPNIDYLAYNGVLLNNYYVSPICTPTRSALLTGRHPIHTGMQDGVISGDEPFGLSLNETLMSQHLNKLGYRSHIVGKWHLGFFEWPYTPVYRGFQSHFGYYQGREDYYDHTYESRVSQWGLDFRKDKTLLWNCTGTYSTELFKDEAVSIISAHNMSEPLFLYLAFQAVHSGNKNGPHLQAPAEYINKFKYIENKNRNIYAGMVSALDDAVGTVYDTLKKRGMLGNSIIIFSTDNGGPANGYDMNVASNFPLRGTKWTLWEGGVRGVGLVHSPLFKKQGYVANQLLHVCDWLPTLYRAAGGDPSELKDLDGVDAWDMLSNNGEPVRSELLHNIASDGKSGAIRVGDYKLVYGNMGHGLSGWFPPYQLKEDDESLHVEKFTGELNESAEKKKYREALEETYPKYWSSDVYDRINKLHSDSSGQGMIQNEHKLNFQSEHTLVLEPEAQVQIMDRPAEGIKPSLFRGNPVKIDCGDKPANASTNCEPEKAACLYHIPSDPCEYNNIATANPHMVSRLMDRLSEYAKTMVPSAAKPFDDAGNPKHHGGAWVPWR